MSSSGGKRRLQLWHRFPVFITLLYAVPMCALLAVMGVVSYERGVRTEMDALQGRLRGITVALAQAIPPRVADPDWSEADRAALIVVFERVAAQEPDVASIYVVRRTEDPGVVAFSADWVRDGDDAAALGETYDLSQAEKMGEAFDGPVVEDEIYADKWGKTLSGYAPVTDAQGHPVAVVGCDVTADRIDAITREVAATTFGVYGVAGLTMLGLGLVVARRIQDPLSKMMETTDRVANGELGVRTRVRRRDEFGILADHLDAMTAGLQERERIRAIFGRYVSERVARSVLSSPDAAGLGGMEREVTILFSDIRGYSTISEHLSPSQVVAMLNEYMGAMGGVVDEHGGCVIEFLGDAILAVFGAPETVPDHAERAVRCAIAMQARLAELNREWERSGLARMWLDHGVPALGARIGVHTGRVVAGNMGGESRVKYAVIGDAVNVASRVEGLNNVLGTSFLATSATVSQLTDELKARGRGLGEHQVKGREQAVEVWTF